MSEVAVLATEFVLVEVESDVVPAKEPRPRSSRLRLVLVSADVFATSVAWLLVLGFHPPRGSTTIDRVALAGAIAGLTVGLLASQKLYLARICRLRSVELSRLIRVAALAGVGVYLAAGRFPFTFDASHALWGMVASFILLASSRSAYASCLRSRRRHGGLSRSVVIVGDNDEAIQLQRLLDGHPELGFTAVAMVGRPAEVTAALRRYDADSVVVAVSSLERNDLNSLTRGLLDDGVHVHLSCGLAGIDHRRLRPTPMAHEPLFYLERATSSPWQRAASRSLDIVGSVVGLLISTPALMIAAIAIKLHDRGPVLFSQERIGQNGRPFQLHKLRTMVPNAEACLPLIKGDNQRNGPLFKSDNDPRVTPIGRLLRATSIDELPQLLNVLMGTMSLVGPRPALAHEVAQFDDELLTRHRIRPGITGLWQVEARNDPSFDSYRRLDLFYLENWSLMLDVVILVGTVKGLFGQAWHELRDHGRSAVPSIDSLDLAERKLSSRTIPA